MRITTGIFGGRTVTAPKTSATRPMADKVRAALFNVVGNVSGAIVLDAYAGSGAVGFEALSRGAVRVVAVEGGRAAARAIQVNQATLGGLTWGYELHQITIEAWLARWLSRPADMPVFDLIVADPPYDFLKADVLEKLGSLLVPDGILVVSHSSRLAAPELVRLTQIEHKTYGDTALSFYKPT
jgi:16S rRNA (guanine966-N2)-methyltransferase